VRRPLLRVALTGGIATGKSVCLRRFAELGAPVIDADALARDAVATGTPALAKVVERFGPSVLRTDGSLDRAALGQVVFADAGARADLERIVHPIVYDAIARWFDDRQADTAAGRVSHVAVADIPLLYETGHEPRFDRVVVAACRADQQVDRLVARDGLTEDEARQRLAAQWPIERKRAMADLVIDTSGSLADTRNNVDCVWALLTG
jgi:dephospho-CoA kinase